MVSGYGSAVAQQHGSNMAPKYDLLLTKSTVFALKKEFAKPFDVVLYPYVADR